jgi:hypothetical protein
MQPRPIDRVEELTGERTSKTLGLVKDLAKGEVKE